MIIILDFGSQYTQLIARRVRELGVYCEILPFHTSAEKVMARHPDGIILSGGPASVYGKKAPKADEQIFEEGVPVLGICYGMQLLAQHAGGKVHASKKREFGPATVTVDRKNPLFRGLPQKLDVWMSHGDKVNHVNHGFRRVGRTATAPYAAIHHSKNRWFGVQFHPEVHHTKLGKRILQNFVRDVCGVSRGWTMSGYLKTAVEDIRAQVGKGKVICALSGGVDSSVAAALAHRALGKRVTCVFVDHGLLREGDSEKMRRVFKKKLKMNVVMVNAKKRFLAKLKGVTDPERKRKIIGREFIAVFDEAAKKIKGADFLLQGTLYPDVIESVSVLGPSVTIKSHHNVGGLPKRMKLKLVEPLKFLFKDEVRRLGRELALPREVLGAHPFPGPGLAIRIMGAITEPRLEILRRSDTILREELHAQELYDHVWQAFTVLLPVKTVGVMGDERTYENVVAVRMVSSVDGMTADWSRVPADFLAKVSNRIINEIRGVNRVVYDISSKPPATIEWE